MFDTTIFIQAYSTHAYTTMQFYVLHYRVDIATNPKWFFGH
jgi:hypothetical protein